MIVHQNDLQLIKVTGIDAEKFLQGQLTCDIKQITETHSSLGAHCNLKGRIVSLFRLFKWREAYYLSMPTEIMDEALILLEKHALFSKITLQAEQNLVHYGYYGDVLDNFPHNNNAVYTQDNFVVIKISDNRYQLIGDASAIEALNLGKITHDNYRWQCDDIYAGLPRLHKETIAKFLPHHINLPNLGGVSFTKGCYLGQEIVARMQHLGKLKQHMVQLTFTEPHFLPPGEKIYLDQPYKKPAGQIITSAIEQQTTLTLALLRDDVADNRLFFCAFDNKALQIK
ncbi:MAG: folate-binding protein YgfZ [Gammaproteobacteria bacterium]|nr:folate-binding protein YgfZ [Gammaproteobacteria bacterium]